MTTIQSLIDNGLITNTYSTPEFEEFMRIAHKLNGYHLTYSEIFEDLRLYNRYPARGRFIADPVQTLRYIIIDTCDDEFSLKLTRNLLNSYECLNHLSERVKKSVFACICMANNSISVNQSVYARYLETMDDIEEFADFMNNIPEDLKREVRPETDDEYLDLLFNKFFQPLRS